jgi:PleD family two-component response regulator
MTNLVEDLDLHVSISIGVTDRKRSAPQKLDDMLFHADTALYRAKGPGQELAW